MKKIPIWSASSLDAFLTCPHKYFRLRVAKDVKDLPRSDAVIQGSALHKAFENAVNYGDPLPLDLKKWEPFLEKVKKIPGERMVEYKFIIDSDFHEAEFKNGWAQGIADLIIKRGTEVLIFDWKTGKRKQSNQLDLYAAFAFIKWPEVQTVSTAFVWLKEHKIDKKKFTREDTASIWQAFLPLVRRMELAFQKDDWQKRPSGLCRNYCPVSDCKYCGK